MAHPIELTKDCNAPNETIIPHLIGGNIKKTVNRIAEFWKHWK